MAPVALLTCKLLVLNVETSTLYMCTIAACVLYWFDKSSLLLKLNFFIIKTRTKNCKLLFSYFRVFLWVTCHRKCSGQPQSNSANFELCRELACTWTRNWQLEKTSKWWFTNENKLNCNYIAHYQCIVHYCGDGQWVFYGIVPC
jgi:hypothetical protein